MPKALSRLAELLRRCIVLGLLLAGAISIGQPVAEAVANDRATTRAATSYAESVRSLPATQLSAELAAARAYNAGLPARALTDPWGSTTGADAAHRSYLATLPGPAMGRLRIPGIAVDMPIRHDADEASLATGVGHMYGSALPVGGADTHAVLAAHSGMRAATFFDRLPELQPGQRFSIDVAGATLTYQIDQIRVVEPTELAAVGRVPGQDLGHPGHLLHPAGRAPGTDAGTRGPGSRHTGHRGRVDRDDRPARHHHARSATGPGLDAARLWISGGALAIAALMLLGWLITDLRRALRPRHKENSR